MPLQRITPGDSFIPSARSWNEMASSAETVKSLGLKALARAATAITAALSIPCENASGEALEADFPIMRLAGPWFKPADHPAAVYAPPRMRVMKPDAETGADFVIMQGGCPHVEDGKPTSRPTVFEGASYARIDITDAAHRNAVAAEDDIAKLKSASAGARILWAENEEEEGEAKLGEQWCIVIAGSSGASRTPAAQWAIVTGVAAVATWTGDHTGTFKMCPGAVGKCILLEEEIAEADDPEAEPPLIAGKPTGCFKMPTPKEADPEADPPVEAETLADYELPLRDPFDEVPLKLGSIIKIWTNDGARVSAGPYPEPLEDRVKVWAEYLKPTDFLLALPSAGANKILTTDGVTVFWDALLCGGPP